MSRKFAKLKDRLLVDIDNERPYAQDILGLSQSDEILDFQKNTVILKEGDYIYTFTENREGDIQSYIFAEGYVIRNSYPDLPYKWCCKLVGEVEYSEDYDQARFNHEMETILKSQDKIEILRNYALELNRSGVRKEELYKLFHQCSIELFEAGREGESAILEDVMDMMTGWYSGKNLDLD